MKDNKYAFLRLARAAHTALRKHIERNPEISAPRFVELAIMEKIQRWKADGKDGRSAAREAQ